MTRAARSSVIWLWVAVACALLIGAPSLSWPLGPLQQRSFELARDWWQRDLLPYRNVNESRLPGIDFVYLLAQIFFGARAWGVRLLELVAVVASARAAAQAAVRRRISPSELAPVLVAFSACWFTCVDAGTSARKETWAALCVLAAISIIAADRNHRRAAMVSGLWSGSALMLLPQSWIFLPLVFGQLFWLSLRDRQEPEKLPTLVEIPVAFLAGALQPPFFFAAYFASHKGAGLFYRAVVAALESEGGGWPAMHLPILPLALAALLWVVAFVFRARRGPRELWPSLLTLAYVAVSFLAARGSDSWVVAAPALGVCFADGLVALAGVAKLAPAAAAVISSALLFWQLPSPWSALFKRRPAPIAKMTDDR